jgi:PAS domain S-box-containing protein
VSNASGHIKLKRTIFFRTGGLMVELAVGIFVACTVFVIGEQRDDEKQQALGMARFLADQANELGLWENSNALKSYFEQIKQFHFTFDYVVVRRGGQVVFHSVLDHKSERWLEYVPKSKAGDVALHRKGDGSAVYDAAVSVPAVDAVVHVGVLRGPIEEHTANTLRSTAAGSIFALLLGLVLAWTVAWMTTREVAVAEAALRESEERYRHLFEHSPDSIMLMKMSGTGPPMIIDCNEATCDMHGYVRDEIIGSPISMLDSEEDREKIPERAKRVLQGEVVSFEGEHLRKDGSRFPVEVVARMVEIGGEAVLQGIDRDISARRKAEEEKRSLEAQLVQAQKMDAIGRLAGGIAHDMNNVLGSILGSASLLEDEVGDDETLNEHLDKIVLACHRGRDFTRNFLGYARKGTFVRETINLNQLIDETTGLLTHTIPKKVTLETTLDADLQCIRGDRALVGQALMNVCLNSVDAMEGDGTLRIESFNLSLAETGSSALRDLEPGGYVKVTVRDTGPGMDKHTVDKVFEPFYSTKPRGKGTGLGLSMVHGTMVSHHGTVTIDSEPGAGTTVSLFFPATTDLPCEPESKASTTIDEAGIEGAGVLLVEDETLLRHIGREMLTKLGCTVIVAEDGRQALDEYRRRREHIALVVLDLEMPEMDGSETFAELKRIDPNVCVLIASGFTNDEVVDELLANGAVGFVEKPFDKKTLAEAVVRALGGGGDAQAR